MNNPYSIICAFKAADYRSYWFETGTPTYLVELLQAVDYNLESMANTEATGNCRIIRIGLNFSSETRNIDRWVIA